MAGRNWRFRSEVQGNRILAFSQFCEQSLMFHHTEAVNLLSALCLTVVRWPSKAVEAGIDGLGRPSYEKFTATPCRIVTMVDDSTSNTKRNVPFFLRGVPQHDNPSKDRRQKQGETFKGRGNVFKGTEETFKGTGCFAKVLEFSLRGLAGLDPESVHKRATRTVP